MPLALHFAFNKKMGVMGLWFGMAIACVILDLGFWFIIHRGFKHYDKECNKVSASPSPEGRRLAITMDKQ
jgi:hypothetical protein